MRLPRPHGYNRLTSYTYFFSLSLNILGASPQTPWVGFAEFRAGMCIYIY
jgi:hypothetical protein